MIRVLAPAQCIEALDIVVAERDDLTQRREHLVHVLDLLGRHLEPERGDVIGEQHTVAVVDEPASGCERTRHDAVRIRTQREFVVARDFQICEAHAEADQTRGDDQKSDHRAPPECERFLARVL